MIADPWFYTIQLPASPIVPYTDMCVCVCVCALLRVLKYDSVVDITPSQRAQ